MSSLLKIGNLLHYRLAEEDRNAQLQIDLDRLCNMLEE